MITCYVLNEQSPMYRYYTDLRGITTANQSKATQSDNIEPFRKCRVRIVPGRYYEMYKIAP
jgi:hypothetical protein